MKLLLISLPTLRFSLLVRVAVKAKGSNFYNLRHRPIWDLWLGSWEAFIFHILTELPNDWKQKDNRWALLREYVNGFQLPRSQIGYLLVFFVMPSHTFHSLIAEKVNEWVRRLMTNNQKISLLFSMVFYSLTAEGEPPRIEAWENRRRLTETSDGWIPGMYVFSQLLHT